MPLAGEDLEGFLTTHTRPELFAKNIPFYSALAGLASALDTLHQFKYDALGTIMIGTIMTSSRKVPRSVVIVSCCQIAILRG
jgi:hypothetical protein